MSVTERRPPELDILDHSLLFHNIEPPLTRDRYNTPRDFYDAEINQKSALLKNALTAWEWFARSQDRIEMTYDGYTWENVHNILSKLRTQLRYLIVQRIRIGGPGMSSDLNSDLKKAFEIVSRQHSFTEESTPLNSGMVTLVSEEIKSGFLSEIDQKLIILGAGAAMLGYIIFSK